MDSERDEPFSAEGSGLGPGYETRDANTRRLMIFGAGLLLFIIVVEAGMRGLYGFLMTEREPAEVMNAPVNLYRQLEKTKRDEDVALYGYGWVDRQAGSVRIPIWLAMELVAKRGVPRGKGPKTEVEVNSHHGTPANVETKDMKK